MSEQQDIKLVWPNDNNTYTTWWMDLSRNDNTQYSTWSSSLMSQVKVIQFVGWNLYPVSAGLFNREHSHCAYAFAMYMSLYPFANQSPGQETRWFARYLSCESCKSETPKTEWATSVTVTLTTSCHRNQHTSRAVASEEGNNCIKGAWVCGWYDNIYSSCNVISQVRFLIICRSNNYFAFFLSFVVLPIVSSLELF